MLEEYIKIGQGLFLLHLSEFIINFLTVELLNTSFSSEIKFIMKQYEDAV